MSINPLSVSVAPCVKVFGGSGYRIQDTLRFMQWAISEAHVDGFEFQNLAEWDRRGPPRDEREKRLPAWKRAEKHSVGDLAALLAQASLPVLSVHANRDVGTALCSGREDEVRHGKTLIEEGMALAQSVGARVCVIHLWDTWLEDFDVGVLEDGVRQASSRFPKVRAAVENVPTHLDEMTPRTLLERFHWITLDLRWAMLFDELAQFQADVDRIANVHVPCELRAGSTPSQGDFESVLDAVRMIVHEWDYTGPLTIEPRDVDPHTTREFLRVIDRVRSER